MVYPVNLPTKTEVLAVRRALPLHGIKANVRRGTGTAASWIEINVKNLSPSSANFDRVERIAAVHARRDHLRDDPQSDLFRRNILVEFSPPGPVRRILPKSDPWGRRR